MTPLDSAAPQLPGTLLSTAEVSTGQQIHEISVAMSPLQHAQHLENFADIFGEGWLDQNNRQLCMQFQFVTLFDNTKVDGLWLSVSDADERIALLLNCSGSPLIGQRYPRLPWSSKSRFVVDEVVELPDWATDATKYELFAGLAGTPEKIGDIYVRESTKSQGKQPNDPMAITSTSVKAATAILIARRFVERVAKMNRLFLLTVVLPTLLSTAYFGFIASDVYISESQFVVRSPTPQTTSPLGSLLQGAGFPSSQNDSYSVQNFILSRDALHTLDGRISVRNAFTSKDVDIFSRFAGLYWDHSFEAMYKYYQRVIVDVQIDSTSSILTLDTRAFTAEESFRMNQILLEMSEALVNQMGERSRQDMIDYAVQEVTKAEIKDKDTALVLARLQTESANVASSGRSLVSKVTEYQRSILEKDIADKILATALSSLEEARNQALRKQLYLERIVQPSKPDTAIEPRRLRNTVATFVLGLIVFGILSILIAGVKEHHDR